MNDNVSFIFSTSVGRESSIRLLTNGSSKLWGRSPGARAANNNQERTKLNYSKTFLYKPDNVPPFPRCCEHEANALANNVSSTESFFLPV